MSITLDSDRIVSLLLWDEDSNAIPYTEEDIAKHGLTTTYEVICDNYSDECEVDFYDVDDGYIGSAFVGEIRAYIYEEAE